VSINSPQALIKHGIISLKEVELVDLKCFCEAQEGVLNLWRIFSLHSGIPAKEFMDYTDKYTKVHRCDPCAVSSHRTPCACVLWYSQCLHYDDFIATA
jgi:hypothetical protein